MYMQITSTRMYLHLYMYKHCMQSYINNTMCITCRYSDFAGVPLLCTSSEVSNSLCTSLYRSSTTAFLCCEKECAFAVHACRFLCMCKPNWMLIHFRHISSSTGRMSSIMHTPLLPPRVHVNARYSTNRFMSSYTAKGIPIPQARDNSADRFQHAEHGRKG